MDAYKCDICGNFYTDADLLDAKRKYKNTRQYVCSVTIKDQNESDVHDYDLCPYCAAGLLKMFEQRKSLDRFKPPLDTVRQCMPWVDCCCTSQVDILKEGEVKNNDD